MTTKDDAGSMGASADELVRAALAGDAAKVDALVAAGTDLDATDGQGRTAMMAATYGHHTAIVERLLREGADPNIRDASLDNPFLYAGAEGYLDILSIVAKAGADPTLTNRYGGTALIPACERGHVEVVEFLLRETRVDVNHVNRLGWTGLMEAVVLGSGGPRHVAIVKLLLAHGADPNIPDRDGVTALAHATRRGFTEIVDLLRGAGGRS